MLVGMDPEAQIRQAQKAVIVTGVVLLGTLVLMWYTSASEQQSAPSKATPVPSPIKREAPSTADGLRRLGDLVSRP